MLFAAFSCNDPRSIDPRGIVTYVLGVAAGEIGDPIARFVLVVINNFLFHVTEAAMTLIKFIDGV